MSESLKSISPRDWLAEKTGIAWGNLCFILEKTANAAPAELSGELRECAFDCLRMAALSDDVATDGELLNYQNTCEIVLTRQFELHESLKPYLVFDFDDWRGSPISAREGCEWAVPMVKHRQILSDLSLEVEEIHNRIFVLLSLAPEEKVKELERTREELEAARASNPFGLPENIEDFGVRQIFELAQGNGYSGKLRQLRQHLAIWKDDDERASGEKWLLSRTELEQFLRYLSERQRAKT